MFNTHLFKSQVTTWATPENVFNDLDKEFHFDLDVCADSSNHKCKRYFDEQQNGLNQPWGHSVCWMNPPYGRGIHLWMEKAYKSSLFGATVVCLVPARTDTKWWHQYAMHGEIRFLTRRLSFAGSNNKAPFPSAVVIFRTSTEEAKKK